MVLPLRAYASAARRRGPKRPLPGARERPGERARPSAASSRRPGPVSQLGARVSLLGRAEECALLDDLLDGIRQGESRSLVLRGEAGVGKTALLRYLDESASDLTVARAVGIESE